MKSILESGAGELAWDEVLRDFGLARYELRAGGETLATCAYNRLLTPSATAESVAGRWHFRHEELLGYRIQAFDEASGAELASFARSFTIRSALSGAIHCRSGAAAICHERGTWAHIWEFTTEGGERLLLIRDGIEVLARVEITRLGLAHPDLQLLTLFGWYLRLSTQETTRKKKPRQELDS